MRALRLLAVAAALAAVPPATRAAPASARAVVEEDFARAFATAKAKGALVLVEVWAPW